MMIIHPLPTGDPLATIPARSNIIPAAYLLAARNRSNIDAFQEFRLRIGIAIGPVIAGVVGKSCGQQCSKRTRAPDRMRQKGFRFRY